MFKLIITFNTVETSRYICRANICSNEFPRFKFPSAKRADRVTVNKQNHVSELKLPSRCGFTYLFAYAHSEYSVNNNFLHVL